MKCLSNIKHNSVLKCAIQNREGSEIQNSKTNYLLRKTLNKENS